MGNQTHAEQIGAVPRCALCGSERVVKEAFACFNPESGLWEMEVVRSRAFCNGCDSQTELLWSKPEQPPSQRIRELNDAFRRHGEGRGSVLVTSGIQARGEAFLILAVGTVRAFEGFDDTNDPWGEHDFGAIDVEGEKVFFKLDYYADDTLTCGSANPANQGQTHRVMTIMLASEY